MLLRVAESAFLLHDAFARFLEPTGLTGAIPQLSAAAAGILILIGLWTPAAGILIALLQTWIAISHNEVVGARLLATALALGLSLIGPGAWSVDALVFGRKRISILDR